MQSIQSIEGHGAAAVAIETMEGRPQKPKTLPCKFCSKRFRRVEHVQRHERTHTKEKPFSCGWALCGKTFGRRDLLVRHEKLVHLNEGPNKNDKDGGRLRRPSLATNGPLSRADDVPSSGNGSTRRESNIINIPIAQPTQYHVSPVTPATSHAISPDARLPSRNGACNLDLLSDAATQIASAGEVPTIPSMVQEMGQHLVEMPRVKTYEEGMPYGERGRDPEPVAMLVDYPEQQGSTAFDDYNILMDDFTSTSHFLPQAFDLDQGMSIWPRSYELLRGGQSKPSSQLPSRFPSVAPGEGLEGGRTLQDESKGPSLRVMAADYSVLKNRFDEFSSVLPNDFVFPSRHTLSRFLDGYVGGFHEHVPIIHLPTANPVDLAPELLLAILSVGAQHRFEHHRSNALWYASSAVAHEQIRRRSSHEVHSLLPTAAAYSPHSTRPSPSRGFRHSFSSVQQERPKTQETHKEPYSPNTPQARMETIQALLLLFAAGLWGAKAILHEALSLQSLLAMLVREEGFNFESSQTADWETWIRIEGANRTKLITYCFFNLGSIAYNMPPLLLTSEINLCLPHSSKLWKAESAWQWQEARHSYPSMDIPLQDAFSTLFSRRSQGPPAYMSSLGNYILIHALIQHIFFLKQTSFTSVPAFEAPRGLRSADVDDSFQALRIWQLSFEQHQARETVSVPPQGLGDEFPGGSVAYNSTALWRLASIRLYTDLSPSRTLETRDAGQIAQSLSAAPQLIRSLRLNRAVLQAIHALSMLVKLGVNYVARRKSSEWSMQHSLCNLECAILLSKWLMTLATMAPGDTPLSPDERNLLEMLRRMLDETEFAVPIDPSLAGDSNGGSARATDAAGGDNRGKLRQLAAAVIRVWAETFKGSHIFEIITVVGNGLEGYADLLDKPPSRGSMGGLASGGGIG